MKNQLFIYQKNLLLLALICFSVSLVQGATSTFTNGGGDGLWSNPANWSTSLTPGNSDDAIISSGNLIIDLNIAVKSLTITNGASVNFTHSGTANIGTLTLSGGDLSSANPIIISEGLNWTGESSITSSSSIELATGSNSIISDGGNRNLYANIINYGNCIHTNGSLRFQTGGSFDNYGMYTFDGATFIINTGGGAFTNYGTLNKDNSNELNFFAELNQDGNGSLNINAGTLTMLWSGSNKDQSSLNIASGAIAKISSGTYTFETDAMISGAGTLEVSGGIVTIDALVSMSGTIKISGGIVSFNHVTPSTFSTLTLSGGTLQGSGPITINDNFNWTGTSTISSTDSITIASTANGLIYTGGSKNLYTPLINNGTISHTAGNFRLYPGASVQNNGTYISNGPTKIFDDGGGSFDNNGVFDQQKSSSFTFYPVFNNNVNGLVKNKGKLKFTTLNNSGSFLADAASGISELDQNFANGKALKIGFDNNTHGAFVVEDNVNLSGTLDVDVVGSIPSGTYQILSSTSGSITGTFDTENIPSNAIVQYTSEAVNLSIGLLPVELINFEVAAQNNHVQIHWQTTSESNSKDFIIELSQDGQNFVALGTVQAAGNSTDLRNYQFIHKNPANGTKYYRLRQQDFDGAFEYSKILVLNYYNLQKEVSIYPNPTMGSVIIKNKSEKILTLTLRDLEGKVILVRKDVSPGAISLDLSYLSKSMYIIEFKDDDFYNYQEKLMILE